jgi:hypothetical protein
MAIRKYITEFSLGMISNGVLLIQQEELPIIKDYLKENLPDFHIYIIGRRPRITLDPQTIIIRDQIISGELAVLIDGKQIREKFHTLNKTGIRNLKIECPYPNNEYILRDQNDVIIGKGKVALLRGMGWNYSSYLDLEVLYIGQAYGKDGIRTAPDRLVGHSTLQSIYSEAIRRSPDKEIWIILYSFEPRLFISIDGRTGKYGTGIEEDDTHRRKILDNPTTEQQQINFAEAALIKYFQSPYNKEYKDTFPNPAHSTYKECYDLDLNEVCVEIDAEDIRSRLWSQQIAPSFHHICQFNLHSRKERKGMFEFY